MANSDSAFRRWLRGEVDLSAELRTAEMPAPPEEARYQPRHHNAMIRAIARQSHRLYVALVAVLCVVLFTVLLLAAANLPAYGDAEAPTNNDVSGRYVNQGVEETGALNAVTGMILHYRAFDTLGESCVLFVSAVCVFILLRIDGEASNDTLVAIDRRYEPTDDPILTQTFKLLVPAVFMFGIYITMNGPAAVFPAGRS